MKTVEPFIEIKCYGTWVHVITGGIDISKAIESFSFKAEGYPNSPRIKLDFDIPKLIQLLDELEQKDIERMTTVLKKYTKNTAEFQEETQPKDLE